VAQRADRRSGLLTGTDGRRRCWWSLAATDYLDYHDQEWGRPVLDDDALFERLCLEAFQSGLSWLTILRKRDSFRRAFAGFDIRTVARFDGRDVQRLLDDSEIVRNRRKILAAVNNAGAATQLVEETGSLGGFVWSFRPERQRAPASPSDVPASTLESEALTRELKRRGFRFVGPTTVYALMQACGLVNDHLRGCCVRPAVEEARRQAIAAL
jgi:DNA-3-methyladenine glycosylase I